MNTQKLTNRKKYLLIAPIVLLLAVAVLLTGKWQAEKYKDIAVVKKQSITSAVYGIGTVTARQTFQVKVGLTSRISEVFVVEGDYVKKGSKLVGFDSGVTVTTPFDGTVTQISQKVGELAYPQANIMIVTDLKNRYIVVGLDQQSAQTVKLGMKTRLSFEGTRETPYVGVVQSVYPNEGQFLVCIEVSNLPESILPGMTLDTAIEIYTKKDALIVPINSVKGDYVYIKTARMPNKVPIKTGIIDGSRIEIISPDIAEGDTIVGKE